MLRMRLREGPCIYVESMSQRPDDTIEVIASLPSLGQRVEEAFSQLLAKLQSEDAVAWEHESLRFSLWAENLGVHHYGHSSLEYRVREAEPVRRLIASLIQDLLDCIEECLLPSGQSASSAPSDNHDDNDSDEYLDDYEEESQLASSLQSAGDIINRLYRLSTKIRNPGTRLAPTKAYNYSVVDPDTGIDLVEQWAVSDTKHIEELLWDFRTDHSLPYTTEDDPVRDRTHRPRDLHDNDLILLRRLAKVNTLRRKQFGQWRRHRDKVNHETARARRQRHDLPSRRPGSRSYHWTYCGCFRYSGASQIVHDCFTAHDCHATTSIRAQRFRHSRLDDLVENDSSSCGEDRRRRR